MHSPPKQAKTAPSFPASQVLPSGFPAQKTGVLVIVLVVVGVAVAVGMSVGVGVGCVVDVAVGGLVEVTVGWVVAVAFGEEVLAGVGVLETAVGVDVAGVAVRVDVGDVVGAANSPSSQLVLPRTCAHRRIAPVQPCWHSKQANCLRLNE
jgi:hypothetical protein